MRRNKYKLTITLVLSLFFFSAYAQKEEESYLIFSFVEKQSYSSHRARTYYWIAHEKEIGLDNVPFQKLVLDGFSTNDRASCLEGKPFNPNLMTSDSDYSFESSYFDFLENVTSTIERNRNKVQEIQIKWQGGVRKKVTIYATAVKGKFCSSEYLWLNETKSFSRVSIPISEITPDDICWDQVSKEIFSRDYSRIHFEEE